MHIIIKVAKDLQSSLSATPSSKYVYSDQVAQLSIQLSHEQLQRQRFHNLLGQPVLVFDNHHNLRAKIKPP